MEGARTDRASSPVVLGDRLYLLNSAGEGAAVQERLLCLDADTGAPIWERRIGVFLSDVPPHRVAWASPAVDPATGHVYVFGVGRSSPPSRRTASGCGSAR